MQDLRQTPQYALYMQSLGWVVEKLAGNYVYLRQLPLLGTVAKLQRPQSQVAFEELNRFISKNNIAALYLEPILDYTLYPIPYTLSKTCFLPSKTIIVDLAKSQDKLLSQMHPKTRYNIKVARKRGVVIKESIDIGAFNKMWFRSSFTWGNWISQAKEIEGLFNYFKDRAKLLLAFKDEELLGGILIVASYDTAFYMYVGSTKTGKKMFAPTLLVWEAIKISKSMKLKYFDFEGIYDERYSQTKRWQGFTRFKQGFGGKIVQFPSTLVYHKNFLTKLLEL